MKKIFIILFVLFTTSLIAQSNSKTTHVKSYTRKNGTHVKAHDRTASNKTKKDNWSTKGNTNSKTGKRGYKKTKK